jgi:WhiB family redox-sensing transcriptional regulator
MPIRPEATPTGNPTAPTAGPSIKLASGENLELSWQERALCAQTDPEASTREAKRVCLSCDVRQECLEYALAHDERFGIWGGLSERERRRLKRRPA